MSSFTAPADLRMLDSYRWELLSDFSFHVGSYPSDEVITVPKGTITDLTSVPRVFWAMFPPHDTYAKAAIIHDWLYEKQAGKEYADRVFLEAMTVLNVPRWKREILYRAVVLFGQKAYEGKP